jgi:hypothetical protein
VPPIRVVGGSKTRAASKERVPGEGVPPSVDHAAQEEAAERQAAHERRQHGGDGIGRDAEDEGKLARPEDLIYESGRARDEEAEDDGSTDGAL